MNTGKGASYLADIGYPSQRHLYADNSGSGGCPNPERCNAGSFSKFLPVKAFLYMLWYIELRPSSQAGWALIEEHCNVLVCPTLSEGLIDALFWLFRMVVFEIG